MRILVTGHTGFKGAWLSLLLARQGHEVAGLALDPVDGALFTIADIPGVLTHDVRQDIRDFDSVADAVRRIRPEVVIHMAAQPLVRESYVIPRETVETNVLGTVNVLEAVRRTDSVTAQIIVTTDKVYRNTGKREGYREGDPLGGDDPYSASKAAADLLTHAWVASFDCPPTAIVRAGNVIGGGDVSTDRLLPDLIRHFQADTPCPIRYPASVRPWQHVLDCLDGYLTVLNALDRGSGTGEWNFGPPSDSWVTVGEVAELAAREWSVSVPGSHPRWAASGDGHSPEAALLTLDPQKAGEKLGWFCRLSVAESVHWTIEWAARAQVGDSPKAITLDQIDRYLGAPTP